jgi:tetratricopeptide (TPR) repeat protein
MRQRFGPEDFRTLRCRGGLAAVLAAGTDLNSAAAMFEEVLAAQRRVAGPENWETLATANNYANLLIRLRRFDEAEALLEHKLRTYAGQFGEDHLYTLGAAHNLANLDQARGEFARAAEGFNEVWEARRRQLGARHPDTLGSLGNLLLAMAQDGRAGEAAALYRREEANLAGLEQRQDAVTLRMLHNLGHTLMTAGEPEEAGRILTGVHARRRDLYGPYDQGTLYTWVTLAQNHQQAGRLREAANMFEVAAHEAQNHLGAVDQALFQGLWAICLLELGEQDRARALLSEAVPVLEEARHPYAARFVEALGF